MSQPPYLKHFEIVYQGELVMKDTAQVKKPGFLLPILLGIGSALCLFVADYAIANEPHASDYEWARAFGSSTVKYDILRILPTPMTILAGALAVAAIITPLIITIKRRKATK